MKDRENYGISLMGIYLSIALLLMLLLLAGVGCLYGQISGDEEIGIGIYSPISPDHVHIITD